MQRIFDNGWHALNTAKGLWGSGLNAVRRLPIMTAVSYTLRFLRALRQLVHFGPWRTFFIASIQRARPVQVDEYPARPSLLGAIDPQQVADEVHRNSVAVVGTLPGDFLQELRNITDNLPVNEYQYVHEVDESFRQLTEDPGVKSVLRAYLKCEPVLLEASVFVSKPYDGKGLSGQHTFHIDYAGWQSLNLFVYLTDVQEGASVHMVAQGSHRNIGWLDRIRGSIPVEEGEKRFGSTIKKITGPAGTLFFENTEAFHRRYPGNDRRVLINLLFASHRSMLSYGRASRRQLEMRNREFEKCRAAIAQARAAQQRHE